MLWPHQGAEPLKKAPILPQTRLPRGLEMKIQAGIGMSGPTPERRADDRPLLPRPERNTAFKAAFSQNPGSAAASAALGPEPDNQDKGTQLVVRLALIALATHPFPVTE